MKEFTFIYQEGIHTGLRKTHRARRNIEGLVKAKNVRAASPMLDEPVYPSLATLTHPTIAHPFPQVIGGRSQVFYLTGNSINTVNVGSGTITPVTIYNAYDKGSVRALAGGGYWHLADFDDTFFLFNGNDLVFRDGRDKYVTGSTIRTYTQNEIKITTGTSHRGRIVMGGFTPSPVWISAWQSYFNNWASGLNTTGLTYPFAEIGKNWVMWSSIGGFDFPLALMYPDLMIEGISQVGPSGLYNSSLGHAMLFEMMRRNEFGWMPMHWSGEVLCVKSLGMNVAVYGTNGISILVQSNGTIQQDVPPTFGLMDMSRVGILNRACVAGTENRHIFLSADKKLYSMTSEGMEELGYEEFLAPLHASLTVISYDEHERCYYICDGTLCFMLSEVGLTQVTLRPTSIVYHAGRAYGIYGAVTDEEAVIQTQPFDMNIRGIKTLTSINLGGSFNDDTYVRVHTRYGPEEQWITSPFVRVNKEGNAYVRVSGVDFMVEVKCDDFIDFQIDSLQIKWQAHDKRTIRGQYANQDVT